VVPVLAVQISQGVVKFHAGSVLKAVFASIRNPGGAESGAEVLNGFMKEIIPAPQLTILPPKLMSKEKAVAK